VASLHRDFAGMVPEGHIFGLFAKSWEDPMGHGTHVAGSVMGTGVASGGKIRGGAFESRMVAQGMWSPMLNNLTVPTKVADLFSKANTAGAKIHTNSWGSARNLGAYDSFAQQVDEYTAANPDMLVIFAAGNSGVDMDKDGRIDYGSVSSPGTAKNVLTVGSSKNLVSNGGIQRMLKELRIGQQNWGAEPLASSRLSDNAQGLAPFSSRGPARDGRLKPELVAPGTNILSNKSMHEKAEDLWGAYNSDYVWSGGTSMSTPLTAGAAAIVRQYLIEDRKIAAPSASLVKAVLMHTATDMFPGQFGAIGKARGQEILASRPDNDQGYGLVDVQKATTLGGALLVDEQNGLATNERHTYQVRVDRSAKLTATLVYTDAPGAAAAAKALVNDLDLVLIDAQGNETTLSDRINNSEMIETDVPAGSYQVQVRGFNVPQGIAAGKQPYALIVSVRK
jgi:serine protease AprX